MRLDYLIREMLDEGVVDLSLGGGLADLQQPHREAQHAQDAEWVLGNVHGFDTST